MYVFPWKVTSDIFDNGLFVLKSQESCQNIHEKRTVLTCHHNILRTMASNTDDSTPNTPMDKTKVQTDEFRFRSAFEWLVSNRKCG